uniref:Uncharacterized protein n=1 Tax=Anguilla anguilla TaxID=7936 RepID=A0A0E9QNU4_ANGAN
MILLCHSLRHVSLLRCWKLMTSSTVRMMLDFRSNSCRLVRLKMAWGILSSSQLCNSSSAKFIIFFKLLRTNSFVPSL